MTSAINAQIKQGLFILLTASVFFVGGWIQTAAAERLTIAENLVSELLTELESIEANASTQHRSPQRAPDQYHEYLF